MVFIVQDITSPEQLYGRTQLLDNLVHIAHSGANTIIVGARRFGKTSLVKSTQTLLARIPESDKKVLDIYLNFKTDNIEPDKGRNVSGNSASYSYMIARLVSRLYKEGIYTEKHEYFPMVHPSAKWENIYMSLERKNAVALQELLKDLVCYFADLADRTILFIIDEYEHLLLRSLDNAGAFTKLRSLSSLSTKKGMKCFAYWLVGSTTDVEFDKGNPGASILSSAQEVVYVPPISEEDFNQMWRTECAGIEDEARRKFLLDNLDFAREKSGCVPCYGNDLIGGHMMLHGTLPDYTVGTTQFSDLFKQSLSKEESALLRQLATGPKRIPFSSVLDILQKKGLVRQCRTDNSKVEIAIPFLQDYIASLPDFVRTGPSEASIVNASVARSMDLIVKINQQCINMKMPRLFALVDNSSQYERQLRTLCNTAEKLQDFCLALYNTYFERSVDSRPPILYHFFDTSKKDFAQYADLARHTFGGGHDITQLKRYDGRITYPELLVELTGTVNEPTAPDDFKIIQRELLDRFETTLKSILNRLQRR